jgi:hypothetical protein
MQIEEILAHMVTAPGAQAYICDHQQLAVTDFW